ncbi:MAG: hypothetical protein PVH77_06765 [Phycisphaerales bacterium]|jgi:hypothetical protein
MKKEYIFGVLFFGGLWGTSEAILGGALYSAKIPYSSVPLTIVGFIIMTIARVYFPQTGTATFVAAGAMLYKFLNVPFFACHLLGILMTGLCYDLFFSVLRIKNSSLSAAAATYSSYALFGLMITYVFQYEHWVQMGFSGVLRHTGISGSMAALGCAVFVPIWLYISERLRANRIKPFNLRLQLVPSGVLAVTIGLWIFGVAAFIF